MSMVLWKPPTTIPIWILYDETLMNNRSIAKYKFPVKCDLCGIEMQSFRVIFHQDYHVYVNRDGRFHCEYTKDSCSLNLCLDHLVYHVTRKMYYNTKVFGKDITTLLFNPSNE